MITIVSLLFITMIPITVSIKFLIFFILVNNMLHTSTAIQHLITSAAVICTLHRLSDKGIPIIIVSIINDAHHRLGLAAGLISG